MAEPEEDGGLRARADTVTDRIGVPELSDSINHMPNADHFYARYGTHYLRMDGRVFIGEPYEGNEGFPLDVMTDYDWNRDPETNQRLMNAIFTQNAGIGEGGYRGDHLTSLYSLQHLIDQVRAHPQSAELLPILESSLQSALSRHVTLPDFNIDNALDRVFTPNMLNSIDLTTLTSSLVPPLSAEDADTLRKNALGHGIQQTVTVFTPVIERMRTQYPHLFNVPAEQQELHAFTLISMAIQDAAQMDVMGSVQASDLQDHLVRLAEIGMPLMRDRIEGAANFVPSLNRNIAFRTELFRMSEQVLTVSQGNPEVALLLDSGTQFQFNMDRRLTLSNIDNFAPRGLVLPANNAAGTADPVANIIRMDYANFVEGDFTPVWREEVGHMVDGRLRVLASLNPVERTDPETSTFYISHDVLPESVVRADLARIAPDRARQWNARATSENYEAFMAVVNQHNLRISGADIAPQLAYQRLLTEMNGVLNLPWDIYDPIRGTDDTHPSNHMRDSEVMVKFHVMRQRLEELNASLTQPAQLYSSDTPVLDMMATLAPGLTQIYRDQWLPMVNTAVNLPAGEMRNIVLSALSNGPTEEFGLIDASDMAAIRAAAGRAGVTLSIQDNEGGFNDSLTINGQAIRVQYTSDVIVER